jgi:hypothetical protein
MAMWTRRQTLLEGSLVLLSNASICSICSGAQHKPEIFGCTVPETRADAFFQNASETRSFITGDEPMIPHSANRNFDYALAHTLAKLTHVFKVKPGFAYYDDSGAMNAYATSAARLNGSDGTILFGERLLKSLLAARENPDVGVAAVCAHEFGHILQYKHGLAKKLQEGQPTAKRVELQADLFAGYFAGIRKRERPGFPAAVFATTQQNFGDDNIRHSNHHGTKKERADAIVQGFNASFQKSMSLDDLIQMSINYVSTL